MNINIKFLCKKLPITCSPFTWCLNSMGPKTPQSPFLIPTGQFWYALAQEQRPWAPFIPCAEIQSPDLCWNHPEAITGCPGWGALKMEETVLTPWRSFWVQFLHQHGEGSVDEFSFRICFLTLPPQWLQVWWLESEHTKVLFSRLWQITWSLWASASPVKNETNAEYSDRLIGQLEKNAYELPSACP